MTAFQETRHHTEQRVMVHLLTEIERNPSFTQRSLASDLGIALGLMNQYLNRCVKKGWIRASQVSPRRIRYFLTPEGLREKGSMVKDYLARSMTFFRDAKAQCQAVFHVCRDRSWGRVALVGPGDLAEIAKLVAQSHGIEVAVVSEKDDFSLFQAVMITDVMDPQGTFDEVRHKVADERLFVPDLLHISLCLPEDETFDEATRGNAGD